MSNQTTVECYICMENIIGDKNRTTAECGHTFHYSCFMQYTTLNNFGCPHCRTLMVINPNYDDVNYDDVNYDCNCIDIIEMVLVVVAVMIAMVLMLAFMLILTWL